MATLPPQSHQEGQIEFQDTLSGFSSLDRPEYADYSRCIHCGLCLNSCPTYRLWGGEADSPRGRIRQILLVDQGRLELGAVFVTHIDRCLDCRACETACPSGVEYGKLVELARAQIQQKYRRKWSARLARTLFYRRLLPFPARLAAVARILRLYQRSGLQHMVRRSGLLRLAGMEFRDRLLPPIDSRFFFASFGQTFPPQGRRRARVAFFAGCMAQVTFTALNEATIRVLQANGCEVIVPAKQVCCGALAAHAGYRDVARDLARRNLAAFLDQRDADCDAIITNAAGCGSSLKEYPELLGSRWPRRGNDDNSEKDNAENARTQKFGSSIRDASEFLAELGWTAPLAPAPMRATFQDSCHLLHGQKIREAPRQLLRRIPGLDLREMPLADQCCGSAGVYNVTQPAASLALLKEKMDLARSTGAEVIITANPGCILQLRAGSELYATGQQVRHIMEVLDRALL